MPIGETPLYRTCLVTVLLAGSAAHAAPIPGGLVPGTMLDGVGTAVLDATHTAYCMINPQIAGNFGSQSFVTLGPVATAFQQSGNLAPVVLTFPGLAEGEVVVNGSNTQAGYNYYSQGTAVLSFTSATAGTIVFVGSGTTLPNKNIVPVFNSFASSYDSGSNRLYVSFGIIMGPCSVVFRGAFQT